jgi:PAS domain S-box-containing protein
MRKKPSHKELQQKVKALEKRVIEVKQSKAALRVSEQKYQDLYKNAPIAYFSINRNDGSILRFNSEAVRLLGYKKETLAQMNVFDLYADTAHGVSKAKALFERFQKGQSIRDEELQMKRLDGRLIWVNLNIEPVKNNGGDVVESRSMVIDISKRKQAESALRESEEKFRSVTEQSPNMIFINKKGKVVYCNKKCEEVMGYSQEEFCSLNFDFFDLISEESKKTVKSAFTKHLKGQEVEPYEYRLVTKGGDELDAIITTKLIQYEGDTAILGIVTDITRRKKMEDALSESEAKFRALAESAPAAIIILAGEDFIYVNPAFESISGFTEEEALSMQFWELVHPDMQALIKERGLARQRGEAVPAHYELKAVTKDGQERWFDLAAASINYGGQTATLAMAYDITKQSKTSKEIALMLNVSPKAVSFHRGNIRKKLGLVNKKINLRTYLQSFPKQNS